MKRKITFAGILLSGFLSGCSTLSRDYLGMPELKAGKVLCDFHAHPSDGKDKKDLLEMLGSPGLIGLAHKSHDAKVLNYEDAVALVREDSSFSEITPGKLAKYGAGYFARTQELQAGDFEIVAIGWDGDYFPDFASVDEAVKEIHKKNGIAILAHPFLKATEKLGIIDFESGRKKVWNAYSLVDEVESHNSNCVGKFRGVNFSAEELADEFLEFRGVPSSDCHRYTKQAKCCGIYIPRKVVEEGIDRVEETIVSGDFEKYGWAERGPYQSFWSAMKGFVLDDLAGQ